MALGSGSSTTVDAGVAGYVPGDASKKISSVDKAAIVATVAKNAAVDVGSRQITNVAAGTNNGDAVNVSQLKAVEDLASSGWNVTDATGGTSHTANIGPQGTVTFSSADKNMTVTAGGKQDAGTVQVQLADNLDLTKDGSVTMGTTVLNAKGLDIKSTSTVPSAPDVSITAAGISAGMNKITNVVDGVDANDAVNVEQLNKASSHFYSVNSSDATAANYKNDGATGVNAVAAGVGASASADHSVAMGELASATTANSVALGANSSTSAVVGTDSVTIGNTTYTGFAGTKPVGTVSVGSNGNERTITNVAAGQITDTSTDAINGSQLYAVAKQTSDLSDRTVKYDLNPDDTVNYNSVSMTGDAYDSTTKSGGTRISNVAAGVNGGDAVNVDQLDAATTHFYSVNSSDATAANYKNDGATGGNAIAAGVGASASADHSVAMGELASATTANSVALGANSSTSDVVKTTDMTIGKKTYTFAGGAPVGTVSVGSKGNERTITNVAAGQVSDTSTDAINGSQLYAVTSDMEASKTHYYSVNDNDVQGANYDNDGAKGIDSLAAGVGASATGFAAQAVGYNAVASGDNSAAFGQSAKASGPVSVAMGAYSQATNNEAVAIGAFAKAAGNGATALGVQADAEGDQSFAVGNGATSTGAYSNAQGYGATAGTLGSVAIGPFANASANNGDVALGMSSKTSTVVNTTSATVGDTTYTGFAGTNAKSTVSVGSAGSERTITNVAAGKITDTSTDAINGSQLYAVAKQTSDLSDRSVKYDLKADGSVNYGTSTLAGDVSTDGGVTGGTKITNLSQGDVNATSTDAINGAQLYAIAGDTSKQYTKNYGVGVKYVRTNDNGLTESDAFAQGQGSTAVGYNATTAANALNSVAMGNTANAGASGSIAIGASATTKGIEGIAIGQGASASVASAVLGWGANGGALATAVGAQASAVGYQSTALGNGATASDDDSVALGANSSTSAAVGTDSATIGNTTYTGFAGTKPVGTVSVGTKGNERTITNVAAGQITKDSTDAINGSQLYSVAQQTSDLSDRAVKYDLNPDNSVNYNSVTMGGDAYNSVTKSGGTRISNVAAGVDGGDAVNVDQLKQASDDVTSKGMNFAGNSGGTVHRDLGDTLAITGAATTAGTYSGANLKTVTDPTTGAIQLQMADAPKFGGVTINDGNTGKITGLTAGVDDNDAVNVSQLHGVSDRSVKYDLNADGSVNYNSVSMEGDKSTDGGKTGGTKITNLSQGDVNAISTDAINGAQLYAIAGDTSDTYVTKNGKGVKYVRTNDTGLADADSYAQGQGSTAVGYNASATADSSLALGRNSVASVADGIALGSNSVASTKAGIAGWDAKTGQASTDTSATWKSTLGALSIGDAANGQTRQINGVAAGSSDTDAVNVAQLKEVAQATSDLSDRAVKYDLKSDGTVNYGTATLAGSTSTDGGKTGGTKITNLSQGDVSEDSTDAVNGSQLFAITGDTSDTYVTKNGRGILYVRTNDTGLAVADSHALGQASTAVGYNATAKGDGSVAIGQNAQANNANDVAIGSGSTTGTAKGTAGATIAGDHYDFAGANPTSTVSVGSQGEERTITNVAAGELSADSTDAVNGSQLYATNQAVDKINTTVNNIAGDITNITQGQAGMFQTSTDQKAPSPSPTGTNSAAGGANASASGSNSLAVGNGSQASGDNSTAIGTSAKATASNSVAIGANSVADRANSVSVGSAGAERQVTNVAAGSQGTDAVNVSQLKAAQAGSVQYDTNVDGSTNYNSVTLNPGGSSTTIHNVQAGSATTDAVNVGQLSDAINNTQNWAKNYTDNQINQMGKKAYAGTAAALAAANLPQAYQPNQSSAGVGIGTYQGQSAISIGVSTISESGRYIFKASATGSQQGGVGVGVGAGMVW
nr:YadA-like family protein [Dyella amyloliquefaciens]